MGAAADAAGKLAEPANPIAAQAQADSALAGQNSDHAIIQQQVRVVPFAVDGEPDLEVVRRGVALARRERCDVVIGFGGDSALDAGKAIAAMLTNDGDVLD